MSESDADFLDSMEQWVIGSLVFKREHRDRLFDLARRGAAVQWKPCCVCGAMQHWMPLPPPAGETNEF